MTTYAVWTPTGWVDWHLSLEEAEKVATKYLDSEVVPETGKPITTRSAVEIYADEARERANTNASATPGSRFD